MSFRRAYFQRLASACVLVLYLFVYGQLTVLLPAPAPAAPAACATGQCHCCDKGGCSGHCGCCSRMDRGKASSVPVPNRPIFASCPEARGPSGMPSLASLTPHVATDVGSDLQILAQTVRRPHCVADYPSVDLDPPEKIPIA